MAGARALHAAARVTGRPNELTPDGVGYLAERHGTYGIGTAKQLLGWEPKVGLGEGMDRTIAWLRESGLVQP